MKRLLAAAIVVLLALGTLGLPLSAVLGSSPAWASSGSGSDGADDAIDDHVEDQVQDDVESQVEDQVQTQVEDQVEDNVENQVEDNVEDQVEDNVEDQVEDNVEDQVEDNVEDQVEDDVENKVEDDVEDEVENSVEDDVESSVEDQVESEVEDEAEQDIESDVEDEVESNVEDEVEDRAESRAEDHAEDGIEKRAEDAAEGKVEDDVEDEIDAGSQTGAEERAGERVESEIDDSSAPTADDHGGRGTREADDGNEGSGQGSSGGPSAGTARETRPAQAAERTRESAAERFAGLGVDDEGNDISLGEWLVIASEQDVAALEKLGYVARGIERLEGLDRVLAHMQAPETFDIAEAQDTIRRAAPDAEVDYNHVYEPGTGPGASPEGKTPRELLPEAASDTPSAAPIGLIDTDVDLAHPALRDARVQAAEFAPTDYAHPAQHGTSVLSILVGEAPGYRGLLPHTQVYAASVFFTGPNGKEIATTASLVRALDWMTRNRVPVINMSLAGPQNAILEKAIGRAFDAGSVVVAAVGNRGPAAKPLYPAGYAQVIAVTAVSGTQKIYRLANRGPQVDFAAPGVDVQHAEAGGGYRASSGTSLASPFVTAVIATSCGAARPIAPCLQQLERHARDMGAQGFDPVFGYGVIVPLAASGARTGVATSG